MAFVRLSDPEMMLPARDYSAAITGPIGWTHSVLRRSKSFMVEPAIRVESVATTGEYSMRLRWMNGKTLTVDLRAPCSVSKASAPCVIRPCSRRLASARGATALCGRAISIWAQGACSRGRSSRADEWTRSSSFDGAGVIACPLPPPPKRSAFLAANLRTTSAANTRCRGQCCSRARVGKPSTTPPHKLLCP